MRHLHYHHTYEKEQLQPRGFDSALLKRLFGYLRPYRTFVIIAVLLLIVSKGIEAYVPIYIGKVAQIILDNTSPTALPLSDGLHTIMRHCLSIMGLLVIAYALDSVNVVLKNWVGQKGLYNLRLEVYRHIQQMSIDYYNKTAVGSLMTRTIHDVDQINLMFSESIVPLMGSVLLFISICIGLVIVDYRAAIVLAAVLPLVFVLTNHFRCHQRKCYEKIRSIVSAMNVFVQEHLMGASTIRSFGLQEQEKRKFDEINADHRNANIETIHYFASFFAGIDFIQSLSLITVFLVLVTFAPPNSGFQAGTYFTFSLYILMLFRPLADLAERYNLLQSAMAAADRIFHVLDQKTEDLGPAEGPDLDEVHSIAFEDVWFAYKDENWVLKGTTFSINKGESVALVGVTGVGKTTILNLLQRFYDIQKGSITVNGRDIREYPLHALRQQFSVVLQDPEIFSGTIAENICLGNPNITDEKLDVVVDYVNLRPLVNSFHDGLQHYLSERGGSLSTGERQLVSMARAVAFDRSVLILDEATANIDSGTEKIIQNALMKILRDKTSIVIAHRLSTIKDVDRIIVLHDGVVAEKGTHQELLKVQGIYEKLYRLQFMGKMYTHRK
ncbi:MAG: putative ABC transporter ATP-binding protein [Chlamydiae bacterium]|nr:putative ABC transporter ATP-binding protein [Chlamydiota bacterium]